MLQFQFNSLDLTPYNIWITLLDLKKACVVHILIDSSQRSYSSVADSWFVRSYRESCMNEKNYVPEKNPYACKCYSWPLSSIFVIVFVFLTPPPTTTTTTVPPSYTRVIHYLIFCCYFVFYVIITKVYCYELFLLDFFFVVHHHNNQVHTLSGRLFLVLVCGNMLRD